jgi:undecaprenyl-diphosphatase
MLGVHTLTEVVAGYALGVGLGLLTTYFYDPTARNTSVTGPGARAARD